MKLLLYRQIVISDSSVEDSVQKQLGNHRHQTSPSVCNSTPFAADVQRNQASTRIVCRTLHGPVQFAIHNVLGLSGTWCPPKLPLPFGDRHSHVTHCSSGQAHSSSQTASRSVQPFLYGPKCYAVQCIVSGEENPKTAPSPWDFVTPPEEDRATAITTYKNW